MTEYKVLMKMEGDKSGRYIELPVDSIEAAKKIFTAQNFPMASWRSDGLYHDFRIIGSDGTAENIINWFGEILTTSEAKEKYRKAGENAATQ